MNFVGHVIKDEDKLWNIDFLTFVDEIVTDSESTSSVHYFCESISNIYFYGVLDLK